MEALITLDCGYYSKNIIDVIKLFQKIEWELYNSQGKIEFLPLGDKEDFDWQYEEMSETEFYDIVSQKIVCKEMVGVNLFHKNGIEGISLLAYNTNQIILNISINRRMVDEKYTDVTWYLSNIIYKLWELGVRLLSYKLEEFED